MIGQWFIVPIAVLLMFEINMPITISDIILFATLLALFWYAWETHKMKKTMVEQTELEQKPIIDFYYRPETAKHEEYLRIRNSGKGVAYNIQVEPVIIDNENEFTFWFSDPNLILTLGEEKTLLVGAKSGKHLLGSHQLDFLKSFISPNTVTDKNDLREINITIHYENARRESFKRVFKFYCTTPATDDFKIELIS